MLRPPAQRSLAPSKDHERFDRGRTRREASERLGKLCRTPKGAEPATGVSAAAVEGSDPLPSLSVPTILTLVLSHDQELYQEMLAEDQKETRRWREDHWTQKAAEFREETNQRLIDQLAARDALNKAFQDDEIAE